MLVDAVIERLSASILLASMKSAIHSRYVDTFSLSGLNSPSWACPKVGIVAIP